MSQLDLIAELRATRPIAPAELRDRVRELAATAPASAAALHLAARARRRVRGGRAAAVAGVLGSRAATKPTAQPSRSPAPHQGHRAVRSRSGATRPRPPQTAAPLRMRRPGDRSPARLRLQVRGSPAAERHERPALLGDADPAAEDRDRRLGGDDARRSGSPPRWAAIRRRSTSTPRARTARPTSSLKVPRSRVQDAIRRLGALGTIVGENVSIQDLQAGIDTTGAHDRAPAGQARRAARAAADRGVARSRSRRSPASIERLQRAARRDAPRRAVRDRQAPARDPPAGRAGRRGRGTARCTGSASRSAGSGSAPSTRSRSARRSCCCSRSAGSSPASSAAGARSAARPRRESLSRSGLRRRRGTSASPTGSSPNSGLTQPVSCARDA